MYWLYALPLKILLRRAIAAGRRGDIEPTLKNFAEDVEFTFPGNNSWAGTYRSKPEVRRWLERFVKVGLQVFPEEIAVAGPPWNTRFYVLFTDHLDHDGERVYENRGFIHGRGRWGKVTRYEVIEDTEKVAAFDRWLAQHEERISA
jgi:ketosteroid isomerase-like protein